VTEPFEPIAATIDALAWISGRWVGLHEADGIEEWWCERYAGMMLGMFRWHRDGASRFYELMSIEPDGERLAFRLKHFAPGLVGWEERDEAVTLDLFALEAERASSLKRGEARWMVYERREAGELVAWFEKEGEPHAPGDEFRYSRA
jgi:hypothetical protein